MDEYTEDTYEEPELILEDIYAGPEEDEMVMTHTNSSQPRILSISRNPDQEPDQNPANITIEIQPVPVTTTRGDVPSLIFIVPYRDREAHYKIFSVTMKVKLANAPSHKILYIHQKDDRSFNRGAMKNIGFLVVKRMYPESYKNITLVFNDIDTMPAKNTVLPYETEQGKIKHFYGFEYTLGGIVSIKAGDFERLNGFPNFWAWGYEDNLLQMRAIINKIPIDRSVFYKINDPSIIQMTGTYVREVNRGEYDRFLRVTDEGICSITDLEYTANMDTGFIDVLQFNTTVVENLETRKDYDLRNGPAPFKDRSVRNRRTPAIKMTFH